MQKTDLDKQEKEKHNISNSHLIPSLEDKVANTVEE